MWTMNEALVMKLAWGLIKERESLWVQVLHGKYGTGKKMMPTVKLKTNPSSIWGGI